MVELSRKTMKSKPQDPPQTNSLYCFLLSNIYSTESIVLEQLRKKTNRQKPRYQWQLLFELQYRLKLNFKILNSQYAYTS